MKIVRLSSLYFVLTALLAGWNTKPLFMKIIHSTPYSGVDFGGTVALLMVMAIIWAQAEETKETK